MASLRVSTELTAAHGADHCTGLEQVQFALFLLGDLLWEGDRWEVTAAVSGAGPSPGLPGVDPFGTVKVLGTLFSFNLIYNLLHNIIQDGVPGTYDETTL